MAGCRQARGSRTPRSTSEPPGSRPGRRGAGRRRIRPPAVDVAVRDAGVKVYVPFSIAFV